MVTLDVHDNNSSLPAEDTDLIKHAEQAAAHAYAPYSHFRVGAAILLENGKIVTGNNQENAAYPSGLCAERVALFYAMAHSNALIRAIAITCQSDSHDPVSPCGSCRQVIAEYEQRQGKKIRLIMSVPGKKVYVAHGIESLLPFMFGQKQLRRGH